MKERRQNSSRCKLRYDAEKGEYRITGGGANVWDTADAFYFVWEKLSATPRLRRCAMGGTSAVGHRKAMADRAPVARPRFRLMAMLFWHGDG